MRRIYLDGNSLGPPPPGVREAVVAELDRWESDLVDGWNAAWLEVERRVAVALARLLDAAPDEVTCTDSTSVNLFQALVAASRLRPDRRRLVVEEQGFPTDGYVARAVADLCGLEVVEVPRARLADAVTDDVAAVTCSHVDYHTGHRLDLAGLTAAAHDAGALVVADLAHSAGAVVTDLGAWDVDVAVGCTYKFLNGGPGAPGWLYANGRLHDDLDPAIRGWFGHVEPFAFATDHVPAPGAARFRNGTPPILSMVAVAAALEAHVDVDARAREDRATALTTRFLAGVDARLPDLEVVTPREPTARGAQLSFRHPHARAVVLALHAHGVVGDHRPPDVVRFGFSPLYVTDADVDDALDVLVDVVRSRDYDAPGIHGGVVP